MNNIHSLRFHNFTTRCSRSIVRLMSIRSVQKYFPIGSKFGSNRRSLWLNHFVRLEVPFVCSIPLSLYLMYANSMLSILLSVFLVLIGLWFGLQLIENSIVYATSQQGLARLVFADPAKYDISNWEWIKLPLPNQGCMPNEKVELSGLFVVQPNATDRLNCPVILLLHGNAGNVASHLATCKVLLDRIVCNIFILDYRGYGKSSGRPSESGFYEDAICAINYLYARSDINRDKIFVLGQSLGGALATYLATDPNYADKVRGIILENTFTSLPDLASHLFQIPATFWSWILLNQYPTLDRFVHFLRNPQEVFRLPPVLFVSGDLDTLIPSKMMWKLAKVYDKIVALKRPNSDAVTMSDGDSVINTHDPATFILCGTDGLVRFLNGEHNDTWLCDHWSDVIARFISQSLMNAPCVSSHKPELIV